MKSYLPVIWGHIHVGTEKSCSLFMIKAKGNENSENFDMLQITYL